MTDNLPVPINAVKAHIKLRRQQPLDTVVCMVLTMALVALMVKPLQAVNIMSWWWGSFCIFNLVYLIYGMKKGFAKGDAANGLVVMTGPIAFYFWTMLGAWRKYVVYKKGGYGWTLKNLEKDLVNTNLSQGFDFEFNPKHRRKVMSLLKACKLTVEEVIDDPWYDKDTGKSWDCLSVADSVQNMTLREDRR